MTFTDIIKKAIQKSDMTSYRIAEESGLSRSALSRFLSGERSLNLESVERLCVVLDLALVEKAKSKAKGAK